jgi:hypothetical protein
MQARVGDPALTPFTVNLFIETSFPVFAGGGVAEPQAELHEALV